ncbi:ATP synthase subunit d, mitochondrial-like [Mytilus galloprovincialis]|uniref:ATPeF0D n=1 Tax=Mytilus edulis TaxID=6550 RepID=A0A8S3Q7P2_MYTED|nr:ATP5H [Mytilus edulis]
MASKRISKTAIDWKNLATKLGEGGKSQYRHIKGTIDGCLSRVNKYPEEIKKIDFAYYKSRMADPTMAAAFEKAYTALKVPYPEDSEKLIPEIEKELTTVDEENAVIVENLDGQINLYKEYIAVLDSLPPLEEITKEMALVYFPSPEIDIDRPAMYPFTPEVQPEASPSPLNYGGKKW